MCCSSAMIQDVGPRNKGEHVLPEGVSNHKQCNILLIRVAQDFITLRFDHIPVSLDQRFFIERFLACDGFNLDWYRWLITNVPNVPSVPSRCWYKPRDKPGNKTSPPGRGISNYPRGLGKHTSKPLTVISFSSQSPKPMM